MQSTLLVRLIEIGRATVAPRLPACDFRGRTLRTRTWMMIVMMGLAPTPTAGAQVLSPRSESARTALKGLATVAGSATGGLILAAAAVNADGYSEYDDGTLLNWSIGGAAALGVLGQLIPWSRRGGGRRGMRMHVMPGWGLYDLANIQHAIGAPRSADFGNASEFALGFQGPVTPHWSVGLEASVINHKYEDAVRQTDCYVDPWFGSGCIERSRVTRASALNSYRLAATASYTVRTPFAAPQLGGSLGYGKAGISASDSSGGRRGGHAGAAPMGQLWTAVDLGLGIVGASVRAGYQWYSVPLGPIPCVRYQYREQYDSCAGPPPLDRLDFDGAFLQVGMVVRFRQ